MKGTSPSVASDLRRAWAEVNAVEFEETHRMSLEERLRALDDLHEFAMALPCDPREAREIRQVRTRWVRLKRALRGVA